VGVVTNSDDRVPGILSSLGFTINQTLRFNSEFPEVLSAAKQQNQIDFSCMSYDVGAGKPSRLIFDAAEAMASRFSAAKSMLEDLALPDKTTPWLKIYVGDEFENDVVGAINAGWNSVFVGPPDKTGSIDIITMKELKDHLGDSVGEVFSSRDVVSPISLRADTIEALLRWLSR
jgi:ribonucleotide monophosphatase NagD (HAD superfamily)